MVVGGMENWRRRGEERLCSVEGRVTRFGWAGVRMSRVNNVTVRVSAMLLLTIEEVEDLAGSEMLQGRGRYRMRSQAQ